MRILVIEDEDKTAKSIQNGLEELQYKVDIAQDGKQGLLRALSNNYQLIILDLMLPGLDGWSILAELKEQGKSTPVLMLTALNTTQQKVRGLQSGAADYLCKPFAFTELLARIEALLRRTQPSNPEKVIHVEDLLISYAKQSVYRNGCLIELSPKEFQLICILAENSGRFVSRYELAAKVWKSNVEYESNIVESAMRRLRQKIDSPFDVKLIHSTRGLGYALGKK